jgi:hypothetical protein
LLLGIAAARERDAQRQDRRESNGHDGSRLSARDESFDALESQYAILDAWFQAETAPKWDEFD